MVNFQKLLYVGEIWTGSTTHGRVAGLRKAGFDVVHFGVDQWLQHPFRVWKAIEHRLGAGPIINDFNRHILIEAERTAASIIWIDKGIWVAPETIRSMRERGAIVVHYTPDPALSFHATRKFRASVPEYDILFTTKAWEMDLYRARGAKRVVFSQKGTDDKTRHRIDLTAAERPVYASDVVFVGHSEPHYVNTLRELIRRLPDLTIKIWGDWGRAARHYPDLKIRWQGGPALGDDYCRALSGAKIALGLLSKLVPETETARTFEIPACRTFLLAERSHSHVKLFREGAEAEFFESLDEAEAKIRHFLGDHRAREAIAEAGHQKVLSSYLCRDTMAECAAEIRRVMTVQGLL